MTQLQGGLNGDGEHPLHHLLVDVTRVETRQFGVALYHFHIVGFGSDVAVHRFVLEMQTYGDAPSLVERQLGVDTRHERGCERVAVDAADGLGQGDGRCAADAVTDARS